ncbi:hypothetical protein VUR80DRAFT_474 [Thermomyces stellatus]
MAKDTHHGPIANAGYEKQFEKWNSHTGVESRPLHSSKPLARSDMRVDQSRMGGGVSLQVPADRRRWMKSAEQPYGAKGRKGSHCAENHACNVALAHLPPQQQPDQVTERYGKITNGSFLAAQTRARLNRWNVPARGGAAQPLLIWRRWLSQGDGPLSGLLIAGCASALFPVGASGAIDGLARGGDSGLANLVGRVPRVPRALRPCSHSHIACEAGPVRQKISQLWRR